MQAQSWNIDKDEFIICLPGNIPQSKKETLGISTDQEQGKVSSVILNMAGWNKCQNSFHHKMSFS